MNDNAENEKTLVERAVRGDREACGELIRRNQDFIYNSLCYMVEGEECAEDLTQSVFLKALENIESFEGRAKFSTWLYAIMINTVRTYRRQKAQHKNVSLDVKPQGQNRPLRMEMETTEKEPWEALVSKENVGNVRACIKALREDHREIVVLRDIEGLSYETLANVLDISPGTVKSRLSRARQELKKQLEQTMGERS